MADNVEKTDGKIKIKKSERNGISSEVAEESFRELCSLISKIDDEKFLYEFFTCLFTPAERQDFSARWLLVKEISKGTTQREIASKFNMSLCKITRGSRELAKPDSAFRKMLDKLSVQT